MLCRPIWSAQPTGTRRAAMLTCFSLLNFVGHFQTAVVEYNVKMARLHPPQQGNLATEVPVLAKLFRGGHTEHSVGRRGGTGQSAGESTDLDNPWIGLCKVQI